MNFLPWHKATKGIIGEKMDTAVAHMLPCGIVHIPDENGLVRSRPFYLEKREESSFTPEEELLLYRRKLTYVFPFYCDSVSGGKDLSGCGTKENPYRSLRHLLKNLFGEKRRKKNLFYLLMGAKLCLKIYLKGVVDYDVEFYPLYGKGWDESYEFYLKDIYLFVSKWEDGSKTEAVIEKMDDLVLRYHYFKGISFRDIKYLDMNKCHFEECSFSGIGEVYYANDSNYSKCDIELTSYDSQIGFKGGHFKNCSFRKEILAGELGKTDSTAYLRGDYLEDCQIHITGQNLYYAQANTSQDLTVVWTQGVLKRCHFHITLTDPPTGGELSNNAVNRYVTGVEVAYGSIADSDLSIAVEHNFAPPPEGVEEDNPYYNHLEVKGFTVWRNATCIRCNAVNRGITGENMSPVFRELQFK